MKEGPTAKKAAAPREKKIRPESREEERKKPKLEVVPNVTERQRELEGKADELVARLKNIADKLKKTAVSKTAQSLIRQAEARATELKRQFGAVYQAGEKFKLTQDYEAKKAEFAGADAAAKVGLTKELEAMEAKIDSLPKDAEVDKILTEMAEQLGVEAKALDTFEAHIAGKSGDIKKETDAVEAKNIERINGATDFDSLIKAVEEASELKDSSGKLIDKAKQIEIIKAMRDSAARGQRFTKNSPLLGNITRVAGLREKLASFLEEAPEEPAVAPEAAAGASVIRKHGIGSISSAQARAERAGQTEETVPEVTPEQPKSRLDNLRADFAAADAELTKKFSGITGWLRRTVDRGGYNAALGRREAAQDAYSRERAIEVQKSVEKLLGEQTALADARAEAFQQEKGWGSRLYDRYKKLGKARIAINIALMGGGFALGAAGAVGVVGGIMLARRLIGGVGAGVGSYDLMNMAAARLNGPMRKLSKERQAQLDEFKKQRGAGMTKVLFSRGEKKQEAKTNYVAYKAEQAKLEAEEAAEQARDMSDQELDKAITYFESATVLDGKKPSENPVYMRLMEEKANRYGKALEVGGAGEEADPRARQTKEQVEEAKKKEIVSEKVSVAIDYLKQRYLVDVKLYEEMVVSGATKEARVGTEAYKKWEAGKKKLQAQFEAMPPEVQTFIDNYSQGRRQPSMEMLEPASADAWKGKKAGEVKEEEVWDAEWKLAPALQSELELILEKNETVNQEAAEAAHEEMEAVAAAVEQKKKEIEARKTAVLAGLAAALGEHDKAVEKRTKKAVYADAAIKVAAAGIAVFVGSGMFAQMLQGAVAEAKEMVGITPAAAGLQEVTGVYNPDDYVGQSIMPETTPSGGGSGLEEVAAGAGVEGGLEGAYGGVFHAGDGPIRLAQHMADADPRLFKGMSHLDIDKWVMKTLQEKGLMEYSPDQGWGYKFIPHPGDNMQIIQDAQGNPVDIKFGPGVKVSDHVLKYIPSEHVVGPVVAADDMPEAPPAVEAPPAPEEMMRANAARMNALAEQLRDAKVKLSPGTLVEPTAGDKAEYIRQQEDFIRAQEEALREIQQGAPAPVEPSPKVVAPKIVEPGPNAVVPESMPAPEGTVVGGLKFAEGYTPIEQEALVRDIAYDRAGVASARGMLEEYRGLYGSRPQWSAFEKAAQAKIAAMDQVASAKVAHLADPNFHAKATIVGNMSPDEFGRQQADAAFAGVNREVHLLDVDDSSDRVFGELDEQAADTAKLGPKGAPAEAVPKGGGVAAAMPERAPGVDAWGNRVILVSTEHLQGAKIVVHELPGGAGSTVRVEGTVVGYRNGVGEGILRGDYLERALSQPGASKNISLLQTTIETKVKNLFSLEEAARAMEAAGKTDVADQLRQAASAARRNLAAQYGDIFQAK